MFLTSLHHRKWSAGTLVANTSAFESGYTNVDCADNPSEYVRRLDEMRAQEFWHSLKCRSFELLSVRPGDRVLDVGCGTGDEVRALAALVGPAGHAIGIDSSAIMIAEAQKRAAEMVLTTALFCQGDAQHLDFADESFDSCRAERIFQHLDRPEVAFAEMVRVTRRGGRIVAVEPDYGAMSIRGADREVTRKILECRCNHFRSGKIGRALPRLCKTANLADVRLTILTPTSTNVDQDSERSFLHKIAAEACETGAISEEESATWLTDLEVASHAGQYRRSLTLFLVSARKP